MNSTGATVSQSCRPDSGPSVAVAAVAFNQESRSRENNERKLLPLSEGLPS